MGAYVNLPVVMLPALFILGFAVSWWWASRNRNQQQRQIDALRADRHRLAQKLLVARDRLAKRQALGRRLKHDNKQLLEAQNRLEAEHAALAVSYANLQANLDDGPVEPLEVPTLSKPEHDDLEADALWITDTEPLTGCFAPRTSTARELHETPDLDDSLLSAVPAEGSIHKVSTRLLKETIEQSRENDELRQQAIRTLAEFEAELLADEPAIKMPPSTERDDIRGDDAAALLAERDAEISRLREQIAPLIGLPLAISAREAERDHLARRLEQAEAKLAVFEGRLRHAPAPESSETHARQFEKTETAPGLIEAFERAELAINGSSSKVIAHSQVEETTNPQPYGRVPDQVDNLKRIRGIGPVLERMLNRLGIYQFRQIAEWTDEDVAYFDARLHDFRGRIERDNWIESARRQLERQQAHTPQTH